MQLSVLKNIEYYTIIGIDSNVMGYGNFMYAIVRKKICQIWLVPLREGIVVLCSLKLQ